MKGLLFVVLLVAALAVAEAVYFGARYVSERPGEELKRRLQTVGSPTAGIQLLRERRVASSQLMHDLLTGIGFVERLEKLLEQTDLETTVASLLFQTIALGLIGAGVAVILRHPLLAFVVGPATAAVPLLLVLNARAKRATKISEQLPETLEMMARAVKAGHALPASFKLVAQECPPPIAIEFGKAYEQQNLGLSLEAGLHNITERVPSNLDLKLLAVSVKIQKETGGNLVEMLENIASTLRERFKFHSKLRTLTAEGRISGVILCALPIVVGLLISIMNPTYISELGHGVGLAILALAIVLWILGVIWIRALMRVEF
jgi:tight adherence protein B